MNPDLKHLATLELGALSARIVSDPEGRKCVAIRLAKQEVCFTITQALLMREMLDHALASMVRFTTEPPEPQPPEKPC